MLIRLLRWFAYIWAALATAAVFLGYLGILIFDGWGKLLSTVSPFNVVNYIALLITFSPALGAYALAEWLSRRANH